VTQQPMAHLLKHYFFYSSSHSFYCSSVGKDGAEEEATRGHTCGSLLPLRASFR